MVDVLEAAAAAVLHADPELVPPEVGAVVGDDVGVAAVLEGETQQRLHMGIIFVRPWATYCLTLGMHIFQCPSGRGVISFQYVYDNITPLPSGHWKYGAKL